jgi:hypothetical protein
MGLLLALALQLFQGARLILPSSLQCLQLQQLLLGVGGSLSLEAALTIVISQLYVLSLHLGVLDRLVAICICVGSAGPYKFVLGVGEGYVLSCFTSLGILFCVLLLLLNQSKVVVDILLHLFCQAQPARYLLIFQQIVCPRF